MLKTHLLKPHERSTRTFKTVLLISMQLNRAFNLDLSRRLNRPTEPARRHQIQNVNVKQDIDVEKQQH